MSRCFPFPPPGYEKKARTNDADILTKEKHKEKKHKKDKREKEKREGKEKDKERSKEKHREKKDRKEKHKDKKDKGRDKDTKRTSDEKRIEGQPEGYNGEKLGQNSQEAEATKDSKFVQELDRRIRDERGTENQMVKKLTGTHQRRADEMDRVVEKDIGNQADGKEKKKDTRGEDRRADGQRNRDEERGMGNAMVQNVTGMDQRRLEGMARPMEKDVEKRVEGKDKNKNKESDDKRGNKHKGRDREKKSKGMAKDKDKEKEKEKKKMKEKREHKTKELDKLSEGSKDPIDTLNIKPTPLPEGSNKSAAIEGNLGKRKGFEMNGFFHDNDIRPNKLTRPASSTLTFRENGRKLEPCQTAIRFASDKQGTANNHKVDSTEHKINGIVEAQPSSICSTKPSFVNVQANENGEASTKSQHPGSKFLSQFVTVQANENGEASTKLQHPGSKFLSQFVTVQANENGEASTKSQHPDSKFLGQILSVPKEEEWSDFDDQEWLFSSDNIQSNGPKVGSSGVTETPQVWAEALQLESADVCALPYVIPY